jgi:Icc-related predicted phosphoesterase
MKTTVRIAAGGDLHYGRTGPYAPQGLFARVAEFADVLVLCGDLTDTGTLDEAKVLAKDLATVGVPCLCVLGNHDFEAGQEEAIAALLEDSGVHVLDGDAVEVLGIGFAGVKGFGGGFGRGALGPWGEDPVKAFVHAAVNEALKLEHALAKLRTPHSIAVLHYTPVRETAEGEPLEIFPYLGSSRLEEPLTRYPVNAVFHGHAHNGRLEGKTSNGVPVYNVALPLLRKLRPETPPFHSLELPRPQTP